MLPASGRPPPLCEPNVADFPAFADQVLFGQLLCSMIWQLAAAGIGGTLQGEMVARCCTAAALSLFGSYLVRPQPGDKN